MKRVHRLLTEPEFPDIVKKVRDLSKCEFTPKMAGPYTQFLWLRFARENAMPAKVVFDPTLEWVEKFDDWLVEEC